MKSFLLFAVLAVVFAAGNASSSYPRPEAKPESYAKGSYDVHKGRYRITSIKTVEDIISELRNEQEAIFGEIDDAVADAKDAVHEAKDDDPKRLKSLGSKARKLDCLKSLGRTEKLRDLEKAGKGFSGRYNTSRFCSWLKQQLAAVKSAIKYLLQQIQNVISQINILTWIRDYLLLWAKKLGGIIGFWLKQVAAFFTIIINLLIKYLQALYKALLELYVLQARILSLLKVHGCH